MDFDEYEYLENTVENPEAKSAKEKLNGDLNDTEEKERKRSSRHKGNGYDDEMDHRTKRSKSGDDLREHDKERRSRRHSSSKDKEYSERDAHKSSRDHRDKVKERDRDNDKEERSRKEGDREERSRKEGDREERSRKEGDREGRSRKEGDKDREDWGRKEGDKDRDEMSRKNRDKDREERSRKEGDSDRDNDGKKEHDIVRKERGNEVERDADREKDRSRRSRSHLGRPHVEQEGEKSREREKSRDRELVEREKEREFRTREREGNRRYKDKKEDRVEPEADPERDQRTVFAYQISLKADDRDVYEFFSRVGKVRDVRLIMDRITKRSKGVGYVEFYDSMSVPMAIALSGQPLLGTPVMVKPSEAEKNLVQSTASMTTGAGGISAVGARKLYVGNLHLSIREDQLRQVFEAFGTVELVQLPTDPQTGQCKGFGFVQFARLEDAKAAQNLNGQLEIAGRVIKVSAVTDQIGGQDIGLNTAGDIDDDDGGGLSLNASSRALLMQKLDRSGTASSFAGSFSSVAATGGIPMPVGPVIGSNPTVTSLVAPFGQVPGLLPGLPSNDSLGVPSECLLLKNMFDPKLETEPDFDLDIKEDVQDECSKFGTLKHIYVDKHSEGFVYLRFEIIPAAMSAQRALHGRWFAGKMITATYMTPETYEAQFPGSG